MNVRPIQTHEIERVAGWLQEERNSRWLDFGGGRKSVDAVGLKVMCQRPLHFLRVFTPDDEDRPIGIVGLSNVDRDFGTAEAWGVLGEKEYGRHDLTVRASAQLLEEAFRTLELRSIFAWTVEVNRGGQRLLERLRFRFVGRRRQCHRVNGRLHDRLLYDLLAEEYTGYDPARSYRSTIPAQAAAGQAGAGQAGAAQAGGSPGDPVKRERT